MNYYNENDPRAAAWIAQLIHLKLIPDGKIDCRSITEVRPRDLDGFTQCHWFAGISGWPLALQLAGISSDTPLWTGSCPCQPFSVAGKGGGSSDERDLWPAFYELIRVCRPPLIFGEQVASAAVVGSSTKAGRAVEVPANAVWLDRVRIDVEASLYAFGASDLPAAGAGAPHIRQRLYWGAWLADAGSPGARRDTRAGAGTQAQGAGQRIDDRAFGDGAEPHGSNDRLADRDIEGQCGGLTRFGDHPVGRPGSGIRPAGPDVRPAAAEYRADGGMGQSDGQGRIARGSPGTTARYGGPALPAGGAHRLVDPEQPRLEGQPGNGRNRDQPRRNDQGAAGSAAPAGAAGGLANRALDRRREGGTDNGGLSEGDGAQGRAAGSAPGGDADDRRMAHTAHPEGARLAVQQQHIQRMPGGGAPASRPGSVLPLGDQPPGPGFWSDYDIVHCTDGRARRIEPSALPLDDGLPASLGHGGPVEPAGEGAAQTVEAPGFPLAVGAPSRVARLNGYGNAIVPPLAAQFILSFLEAIEETIV